MFSTNVQLQGNVTAVGWIPSANPMFIRDLHGEIFTGAAAMRASPLRSARSSEPLRAAPIPSQPPSVALNPLSVTLQLPSVTVKHRLDS